MTQTYQHSPRPVGGPISFALKDDHLVVDSGRKVQEVRLGAVETVRMTYEPGRFAQKAYRTKVTLKDGKTFSLSSLDWRSLIEARELTQEYRTFACALLEAIAQANPQARFIAGKPWWSWISITAIAAACMLSMAVLIWRAVLEGATNVALMGALFALVGIWQIEPLVRLNKPRSFMPQEPPVELLPRGT
jgi:hypothetical protein